MLFAPQAHEPLLEQAWDPAAIEAAIREIVADAEAAFDDGWPTHPYDEVARDRLRSVYLGSAGVVRALDDLQGRGLAALQRGYVPYLEREYVPDFPEQEHHERSLLAGETGIRLVLHHLSPSDENADRLAELIAANARDERREMLWGSPGTMLAAAALYRLTGEARWRELWGTSAAWLDGEFDPESGVWTQHLYGSVSRYVGAGHGFAGCVLALAAGPGPAAAALHERAAAGARRYAIEHDGLANWPPEAGGALRASDGSIRVQWCHGAPGIVTSLAALAPTDAEHERLLCAAGELVWRAGPLVKGPGLCHGTAGNGYAFLALFERTGDEYWLDRARSFAAHAAAQVRRERGTHGRGRYTLWTGDLGAALYLADCLAGRGALPLP